MSSINCRPQHIAIVGPVYIPSLNVSFAETFQPKGMGGEPVNLLINALLLRNFKITVVSLTPEISEPVKLKSKNIEVIFGPFRASGKSRVLDFFKKERSFIKEQLILCRADIVHAHWQYEWGWGALSSGLPTLLTCHDSPLHILRYQFDLYRIFRLFLAIIVLRKASSITTVSESCKKGLSYLTRKKMFVVPNFEPQVVFDLYKIRSIQSKDDIRIVMINNGFTSLKNVQVGILAFILLRKKYERLHLYLYGSSFELNGEANEWLNQVADSRNIHFMGKYNYIDLMHELSTHDILLHTSKHESFGMVLVESMGMGIPVVAGQNSGGVREILNNGGGLLVDIKDPEKVANGLEYLLDEKNYLIQSRLAKNVASSLFNEESVINSYLRIYQSLLTNNFCHTGN